MANPVCNIDSLIAACSQLTNINPKQLKAEIIYLMGLELTAIGGTDYTGALATNLYQDAARATIGMDAPKIKTAYNALAASRATAAGASVPVFQDRQPPVACLLNVPDDALDRMQLFLTCQLGVHKAYTQ